MDIDVMQRELQGLKKFRTLVEQFLGNAGHDLEAEAGVKSIGDRVTLLEQAAGTAPTGDDAALADRVAALESKFDDISAKLADLPAILDGVNALADLSGQKDRLLAAADWIDQNGQQVAELLKIGDDLADPAAGTAIAGAGEAGGTVSGAVGTNPASGA